MIERLVVVYFILNLIACKSATGNSVKVSPSIFHRDAVYGRWSVVDALRNNRPTTTINGAILEVSDSLLTHNLFGTDQHYTYNISDSTFLLTDGTKFTVEYCLDSLLVLNALIQKYTFKLTCKKTAIETILDQASEAQ